MKFLFVFFFFPSKFCLGSIWLGEMYSNRNNMGVSEMVVVFVILYRPLSQVSNKSYTFKTGIRSVEPDCAGDWLISPVPRGAAQEWQWGLGAAVLGIALAVDKRQ